MPGVFATKSAPVAIVQVQLMGGRARLSVKSELTGETAVTPSL